MIKVIDDSTLLGCIGTDQIFEILKKKGAKDFVYSLDLNHLSRNLVVDHLMLLAPDEIVKDPEMRARYEEAAKKVALKILASVVESGCDEFGEGCECCDLRDFCNHRRMMQVS